MAKYYFKSTKKIYEIDANRSVWKNFIIKELMNLKRTVIYLDPTKVNTLVSTRHKAIGRDTVRISLANLGHGKWVNQETEVLASGSDTVEVIDHDNGVDITDIEDNTVNDEDTVEVIQDNETELIQKFQKLKEEGKTYNEIRQIMGINPKKYSELNNL